MYLSFRVIYPICTHCKDANRMHVLFKRYKYTNAIIGTSHPRRGNWTPCKCLHSGSGLRISYRIAYISKASKTTGIVHTKSQEQPGSKPCDCIAIWSSLPPYKPYLPPRNSDLRLPTLNCSPGSGFGIMQHSYSGRHTGRD